MDCDTGGEQVMKSYMRVNRMHKALVEKRVEQLGLRRSQHMILMYLDRTAHAPSQKEIADAFEISPAAVAMTLKKLEQQGFIAREVSAGDTRCHAIRLSEKGQAVVAASRSIFDRCDREMFAGLTAEELDAFCAALEKMKQNLRKAGEETETRAERNEQNQ